MATKVRAVVENIAPQVDCGRFPIKRTVGEDVVVEADVFADGHDCVAASLLYRECRAPRESHAAEGPSDAQGRGEAQRRGEAQVGERGWIESPMREIGNDRWRGTFTVEHPGAFEYTVAAWVDHVGSWRRGLLKKHEAGHNVDLDLRQGVNLVRDAASRANGADAERLREWAAVLEGAKGASVSERVEAAQDEALCTVARHYPAPSIIAQSDPPLGVWVDRERARFSTWYEMFPRSAAPEAGRHGTFADVERLLPYVASMGFDVLYLPPIHPIGLAQRKGPDNTPSRSPRDPGSPWAIGGQAGGHRDIHPQLGTLEEFRHLIASAASHGIELALDLAFQATPDHPYVREHPDWFLRRPDGSIQYAENPPKTYQDIYPFHFESESANELWSELQSVVEYWISQGVRIFRVDNPHTKPFAFWEALIQGIRARHPDTIFLAEAFTRPKVMYRLAKLGFSQSYNYFPWRNTKRELTDYFGELAAAPVNEFFRANLWPNTPDILPEYLQFGGDGAFRVRLVLAATLGASYGIYGPAFELMEARPREPGSEEYQASEKYQIRHWERADPASLREFIARVNRIRRENAPLQSDRGLRFHEVDNDLLIAYSKTRDNDSLLVVVNLDPHHAQSGWLQLDRQALGLPATGAFQAHDLLSGARFLWQGPRQYVALDPKRTPAHLFRIRRRVRSERDFDYFL